MGEHLHHYALALRRTGAGEAGTRSYERYGREYEIAIAGKPVFRGSAHVPMAESGEPASPAKWPLKDW